jgi:hypothetical protein
MLYTIYSTVCQSFTAITFVRVNGCRWQECLFYRTAVLTRWTQNCILLLKKWKKPWIFSTC